MAKKSKKKKHKYDKWPRRHDKLVKKLVDHAWFNIDGTIAQIVILSCDKYLTQRHGVPWNEFLGMEHDDEKFAIADACAEWTYTELRALAQAWINEDSDKGPMFPEALAEAMTLGYLWD